MIVFRSAVAIDRYLIAERLGIQFWALVAWNLRQIRVNRGLSQKKLAFDAGIDRSYVGGLERQEENPTVDLLDAKALSSRPEEHGEGELSGGSHVHAAMNVIFLDIDGVLNCEDTPNPRKFPYIVDARLLSLLKGLLARTGANVVLSSSWRTDPVGLLAAKYYDVPFIDVCPDLPEVSRCEEMLRWLSEHQAVHRYVVIDDESDCLDDLPLFQPSSKTGLTIEIVEGVEKYLSGKTDDTMRQPAIVRLGQNIHSFFKRDKS